MTNIEFFDPDGPAHIAFIDPDAPDCIFLHHR